MCIGYLCATPTKRTARRALTHYIITKHRHGATRHRVAHINKGVDFPRFHDVALELVRRRARLAGWRRSNRIQPLSARLVIHRIHARSHTPPLGGRKHYLIQEMCSITRKRARARSFCVCARFRPTTENAVARPGRRRVQIGFNHASAAATV